MFKDPNERWPATQLLKHPLLDACKITICDKINDDNLKFIIESFIEYYSQRHFLDPTLIWNSGNKMNRTRGEWWL